ncbi:glycosyltransferase family 4 protein [Prosthecobacter dejongeii]|uniref:Glycosyltransferase involved in cell wall biosynthesis n=1 Tax=Prosthecobacter dejongeii TaxID=48465 RepID=A0A7W7YNR6_9BACT|nr:glycosyltransferase family 1 protein [Prosthecobacter dejongeii]MBB5039578.1 glycosyltransferase involved in cell wall biosynthesis [Prosthecobacter dejongeii]
MTSLARIHLAPAHPCMGWVSMNRYWQALRAESAGDTDVQSLVTEGPLEAPAASRLKRQWIRRIAYPWQVRSKVQNGVLHVLDHSFADLLSQVPSAVKTVVTVHDLIPLTDPGDLTLAQQQRFQKTVRWVAKADRVVCVSQHTAGEVQRLLRVATDKLKVLPNGASKLPEADARMAQRLASLPPYIFSVGGTSPRKNLPFLIPLVKQLAERGQRATVVRAGALLDLALASAIREQGDLIELGPVDDDELAAAYAAAALTLVPSTQEGFGLPVLEAMQAGCPVVYSLATSLPEVAGKAGLGFELTDIHAAASHCWRILTDAEVRVQCRIAGLERAAQFTWRSHWRGLRTLYEELLKA